MSGTGLGSLINIGLAQPFISQSAKAHDPLAESFGNPLINAIDNVLGIQSEDTDKKNRAAIDDMKAQGMMKTGGKVRGVGLAKRGHGRGKMV
jgi:hypothetical protein